MLCGTSLQAIRTEIGKLKDKAIACKIDINNLKALIKKKIDDGTDKNNLNTMIGTATTTQSTLETDANKHHFFLRIFDVLYCKLSYLISVIIKELYIRFQ